MMIKSNVMIIDNLTTPKACVTHTTRAVMSRPPGRDRRRSSSDSAPNLHPDVFLRPSSYSTRETPPPLLAESFVNIEPTTATQTNAPPTLANKMSTWFSNMMPSNAEQPRAGPSREFDVAAPPSPSKRGIAGNLLAAAKQRAAGGMRYLLDSEAKPEDSREVIWLLGQRFEYEEDALGGGGGGGDDAASVMSVQTTVPTKRRIGKKSSPTPTPSGGNRQQQPAGGLSRLRDRRRDSSYSQTSTTSSDAASVDRSRGWPDGCEFHTLITGCYGMLIT